MCYRILEELGITSHHSPSRISSSCSKWLILSLRTYYMHFKAIEGVLETRTAKQTGTSWWWICPHTSSKRKPWLLRGQRQSSMSHISCRQRKQASFGYTVEGSCTNSKASWGRMGMRGKWQANHSTQYRPRSSGTISRTTGMTSAECPHRVLKNDY